MAASTIQPKIATPPSCESPRKQRCDFWSRSNNDIPTIVAVLATSRGVPQTANAYRPHASAFRPRELRAAERPRDSAFGRGTHPSLDVLHELRLMLRFCIRNVLAALSDEPLAMVAE
jgi:hypothetical protein